MKTRGRPRHPEVLTPRQQDVLACLREGLTNEEIARRLGITLDGAKFHVSEILLRLGVDNRYDAASWSPEREPARGRWAFVLAPFALLQRVKWGAASYAAATVVVLGAAVGVALLAWGVMRTGGGRSPAPAAGAIGAADPNLIIFAALASGETPDTHTRWTVTVYDARAKRIAHQFDIGDGVNDQPSQVVAAGDTIVANLSDRIVRYEIDGSHPTVLYRVPAGDVNGVSPARVIGIAASPDGTKIALAEQTAPQCPTPADGTEATPVQCSGYAAITRNAAISTADGRELLSVPQTAAGFAEYHGQAALPTWRSDGRGFAVAAYTYSEAPGSTATVMLDGSVHPLTPAGAYATLSPGALYAASGQAVICDLGSPAVQHEVVITRVTDGRTVARLDDPLLNFEVSEWSPDDRELLYHTATLLPTANGGCEQEDPQSVKWYLLPVDGSAPTPVASQAAARRGWYGGHNIEYRCNGQPATEAWCTNADGTMGTTQIYIGGTYVTDVTSSTFRLVRAVPAVTAADGP